MTPRATPAAALLVILAFTFGAKSESNSVLAAGASSPAAQAADGSPGPAGPSRAEAAQPAPKPPAAPVDAAPKPTVAKAAEPVGAPLTVPAGPQPLAPAATASKTPPAPAAQPSADEEQVLSRKIAEEAARVRKLTEQLRLIEAAPVEPPTPPIAPQARPPARPEDIPATPVPQAREEYADALYTLGKYQAARAVYLEIAESKPTRTVLIWARLQTGHCSRRLKDYPAAVTAYESVMNEFSENAWAKEAAWWSAEVKWWMLWNETVRRDTQPTTTPSATPPKQAATPSQPVSPTAAAASQASQPARATATVR